MGLLVQIVLAILGSVSLGAVGYAYVIGLGMIVSATRGSSAARWLSVLLLPLTYLLLVPIVLAFAARGYLSGSPAAFNKDGTPLTPTDRRFEDVADYLDNPLYASQV